MKIQVNVPFVCKANETIVKAALIEEIINLPEGGFTYFKNHLLEEYEFISEHKDKMYVDDEGVHHCLLVTGAETDDGILIECEGYNYARYSAYLPNARMITDIGLSQAISSFVWQMKYTVDKYAEIAIDNQQHGKYEIDFDEVRKTFNGNKYYNDDMFMDMLSEKPEVAVVTPSGCGCTVYLWEQEGSEKKTLSSEQVDIRCAKHTLWFNNVCGEQADFSNCIIKDMDLSHRNLTNMVFDNTTFINCCLKNADISFATLKNARFISCECIYMDCRNSDFSEAEFSDCSIDGTKFINCNFNKALFSDSVMMQGGFEECCIENADFDSFSIDKTQFIDCSENLEEWQSENDEQNNSMEELS